MGDSNSDVRQAESRRLPTGTVVFLFTDVEGSTRRWESDPEQMSRALQLHDETLRSAIESRGGYVFKTVGDGACAAFDRLTQASSAAETIVKQLSSDAFRDIGQLGVRIAIHIGEAYERDGDYFGPTINRLARLLQIGHPGQIILSAAAAESLRHNAPPHVSLKYLEEHRLKDLAQPERVFQLVAPDLRTDFPPLRSLATITENNLPLQSSALIGRDRVIGEVRALLETHRLVTLTGSGGIGKTRLSLQVAAEMLDSFADGVWFVDLAPITDASLVASNISSTLRLQSSRDRAPLDRLLNHLEQRKTFIVLDNCEHLIDEAARISEAILKRCAGVRLLSTSREALDIAGEAVYWIPSLDLPPVDYSGDAAEILAYGSVMLFFERARIANAHFTMTNQIAPTVSEICRRLDGIPLAIELAAARTDFLQPKDLASQLDRRFNVLTRGRRTALRRQQTLRATIDWSFDLLTGAEKRVFRRLAVFVDGWTIESASTVCVDDALKADELFEVLSSLVRKSLVITDYHRDRNRFRFLESTRLYAMEKLQEAQEIDTLTRAHLRWILNLSEDALRSRGKIPLVRWLSNLEPELENIREALRYADSIEQKPLFAGRIVGSLASFWFVAGLLHEGRRRIERALDGLDENTETATVALLSLGFARLTPTELGRTAALRGIQIFSLLDDWQGVARCEDTLAWISWTLGAFSEAEAASSRALAIWVAHDDTNSYDYACALDTSATILMSTAKHESARAAFQRAAELFAVLQEDEGAAISRFNLAELEFTAGDAKRALALSTVAVRALRNLKSLGRLVIALTNMAGYLLAIGDIAAAREAAREVLLLGRRFQVDVIPYAVEHLAAIAAQRADVRRATLLSGYVSACYRRMHFERGATEQKSHDIVTQAIALELTPAEAASIWADGEALIESAAIEEALIV